jgi:hypothetical protein
MAPAYLPEPTKARPARTARRPSELHAAHPALHPVVTHHATVHPVVAHHPALHAMMAHHSALAAGHLHLHERSLGRYGERGGGRNRSGLCTGTEAGKTDRKRKRGEGTAHIVVSRAPRK